MTPSYRGGAGDPLVLLHAGGTSWRLWTPVLPALAARREVFAPTMPGHLGGPPWANGARLTFAALADAVERQLDELGFDRPDVVGNSVGGGVAFELARRGRARRVVAIGPMGMQTDAQARRLAAIIPGTHRVARLARPALLPALALAPARRLILRQMVVRGDRVAGALARQLIEAFLYCDAPALFKAMQAPDGSYARVERASAITAPTLLIWGRADRTATLDQMQRYLDALPNARLTALAGAGHCAQVDQPERVARLILDFITD